MYLIRIWNTCVEEIDVVVKIGDILVSLILG
jgi:hypothetical protein